MRKKGKNILTTSARENNHYKWLGFYLDPAVHTYLTLYAIAHQTRKAHLVKPLVFEWIDKQKQNGLTEEALVALVIDFVKQAWVEERIRKRGKANMATFKARLDFELKKKGIPQRYRNIIFKAVKE